VTGLKIGLSLAKSLKVSPSSGTMVVLNFKIGSWQDRDGTQDWSRSCQNLA